MSRKRFIIDDQAIRDALDETEDQSDISVDDSDIDSEYEPPFSGFSSDSDDDMENIDEVDRELDIQLINLAVESDEEHEREQPGTTNTAIPTWTEYRGRQSTFTFTGDEGVIVRPSEPDSLRPEDVFKLIVDDEVIKLLVEETNRYAGQVTTVRTSKSTLMPNSRHGKWIPTTKEEMKTFLGLILWMGLDQKGNIASYWSNSPLYNNKISGKMSRNRYELMLNCLHFANNEEIEAGDRLGKIRPLLDVLILKYKAVYTPGMDVVIDETLIPWRGRLKFRQFIPNKAHKYGIKLFKVCSLKGFTYNLQIYSEKAASGVRDVGVAQRVCTELMEGLLDQGRTLYVDNFYTSYELATSFLQRNTHVVGTVRAATKSFPKEVMNAKLKKGEVISREEENGVVILKWKDVRDVRMLSTKHNPNLVEVHRTAARNTNEANLSTATDSRTDSRSPNEAGPSTVSNSTDVPSSHQSTARRSNLKPAAVAAYNHGKAGIDLSDQMASCKGVKWHRKLGIELLLGLSIVNAHIVYQELKGQKIKIRKFREMIACYLLRLSSDRYNTDAAQQRHVLEPLRNENNRNIYRICKLCYQKTSQASGRAAARKANHRSKYYCPACPGEPAMCVSCFTEIHKKK